MSNLYSLDYRSEVRVYIDFPIACSYHLSSLVEKVSDGFSKDNRGIMLNVTLEYT